jgi:hypothetical protein
MDSCAQADDLSKNLTVQHCGESLDKIKLNPYGLLAGDGL